MQLSPFKLLQEAVKAVPATRYALGIAGVASVIAIIAAFNISYKVAVFGTLIILGLMFILLTFSSIAAKSNKKSLHLPAMVLTWAFLIMSLMVSTLLATSFFFKWPIEIEVSSFADGDNLPIEEITITVVVMSEDHAPIDSAIVNIERFDFNQITNHNGEFKSKLKGVIIGDIITFYVAHRDYKTATEQKQIETSSESFLFTLKKL